MENRTDCLNVSPMALQKNALKKPVTCEKMIDVYVDGLVQPINPGGIGAIGIVVYNQTRMIFRKGRVIGKGSEMSNNRAEYEALAEALQWLLDNGFREERILVHSDSSLLVNQMQGKWKMKKGLYVSAQKKAKALIEEFSSLSFKWVPREENEEADFLTRRAYDEYVHYEKSRTPRANY